MVIAPISHLSRSLCLTAGMALLLPALARSATLRGTVADSLSRAPIAGAEVVLFAMGDSVAPLHQTTAADGRFEFRALAPGRYRLRAWQIGHAVLVREGVRLNADSSVVNLGRLELPVSAIAMPGSETATERAPARLLADRNVYLTRDLPSSSSGNAADMLRTVPELDVDIDGHVSLRGKSGVNLQFNGRRAPLQGDALANYLRQMPASRIERVEVIPNPSARYDPEGTAGIVNLVLKDGADLGWSGSTELVVGQRYGGPSARLAYQRGPLTAFGGVSPSAFRWLYDSRFARRSLDPADPTRLDSQTDNRNTGRYASGDASADFALNRRVTLYGTFNTSAGEGDSRTDTRNMSTDPAGGPASVFSRMSDGDWRNHGASGTLGIQHVVEKSRDERSMELFQNFWPGDWTGTTSVDSLAPVVASVSRLDQQEAWSYRERSLQADDTRPIGSKGKLETGYRVSERVQDRTSLLLESVPPGGATGGTRTGFRFRERFQSAYLLASTSIGPLSLQAGGRYEFARTTLATFTSGRHDGHDYRSLFPSANAAWDLGKGRSLRLSYARRIDRPQPYQLNPDVIVTDSLNVRVGNPQLGPRHVDSVDLDATWSGSRGSLKLSPWWRLTTDDWDALTTFDALGRASTTTVNAAHLRSAGASLAASLRRTGRVGGTLTLSVSRDEHDASNLASGERRAITSVSAGGNVSFKLTKPLALQTYLRYAPARALAQGRASRYVGSNIGLRYTFSDRLSAGLSVDDPLGLSNHWSEIQASGFAQRSDSDNRMRSVSASFSWSWGKPPETKERKQRSNAPSEGGGTP